RYEALIEHTRLAGRTREAFELYRFALGGYQHLGEVLGDYARGLRMLSAFSQEGTPETLAVDLFAGQRTELINDWGLFARSLVDLVTARRAFSFTSELNRQNDHHSSRQLPFCLNQLAGVEMEAGRHAVALKSFTDAASLAQIEDDQDLVTFCNASLAQAFA